MKWLDSILDLFFPKRCVGCSMPGFFLCDVCLGEIPRQTTQYCPHCMSPSNFGAICDLCERKWALDGLFVVAPYSQASRLQAAIQKMKYHHARDLASRLGEWMSQSAEFPFSDGILIPVPLHKERELARGYNQSQFLAEAMGRSLLWPMEEPLWRHRNTPPQAHLSRPERLRNLLDSFSLSSPTRVMNKKIVLIDDVCSTGATLNECTKILKQNGAKVVWGCVLARG